MRFVVAVLARTHIVRQTISTCLAPLGGRTVELATADELLSRLESVAPDLLVMDIDGLSREWRLVARSARLRRLAVVLLAGSVGFEEAHEALSLGICAIVLKPYRREDHTARLYDIVLAGRHIRPRRREPRYVLPDDPAARLDYDEEDGSDRFALVEDASATGLSVRLGPEADSLPVGSFVTSATLTIANATAGVWARVMHREGGRAGLRVHQWGDGRQRVLRRIDELASRAFGTRREKRRW